MKEQSSAYIGPLKTKYTMSGTSYMPSNMQLVLVSRAEPRLKLARLSMKEDLIRIRASDLRFGTEEISQYFKRRGYSLQKDELEIIESYTEGWAAALVAAALFLKGKNSIHHTIRSFGRYNLHINLRLTRKPLPERSEGRGSSPLFIAVLKSF